MTIPTPVGGRSAASSGPRWANYRFSFLVEELWPPRGRPVGGGGVYRKEDMGASAPHHHCNKIIISIN